MTEFIDYKPACLLLQEAGREILTTRNLVDIALIKSILDSTNITYFFQGENFANLGYGVPIRLMVKKDEVEKAKEILKDFKFS